MITNPMQTRILREMAGDQPLTITPTADAVKPLPTTLPDEPCERCASGYCCPLQTMQRIAANACLDVSLLQVVVDRLKAALRAVLEARGEAAEREARQYARELLEQP
jgi:hypothetical protein